MTFPQRARENNFSSLRLLFASLVIIGHAPEMIDGNRSREILSCLFGTVSFGDLAVTGFFIVSGYLITQSWSNKKSILAYFAQRFARIVPGYLAAFLFCVLIVAPLSHADEMVWSSTLTLFRAISQACRLMTPWLAGTFPGLPSSVLDVPMWTLAYEVRCYLAVAVIGIIILYWNIPRWLLLLAVLSLLSLDIQRLGDDNSFIRQSIRLFGAFGAGAIFFVFRDRIIVSHKGALLSVITLILCLFSQKLVEPALAIFGSYLIFWFAFKIKALSISAWADKTDISYGLYLYAWPLGNLLIWYHIAETPWLLAALSFVAAALIGYLSFKFIEAPSMKKARQLIAQHIDSPAMPQAISGSS